MKLAIEEGIFVNCRVIALAQRMRVASVEPRLRREPGDRQLQYH